jgi:oxygen-independent coproporphyrinogen-3 oxidase
MSSSLYIHIPFCRRRCIYCNFYSRIYDTDTASSLINIFISQLKRLGRSVHSIYIGGGTPSVLEPKQLERLLAALKDFSIESGEFTVEVNPESLNRDSLRLPLDHGVNRLSIGIQSLDERKLKKLGRAHSAGKAREAVSLAAGNGFRNISADLIFGLWGESLSDWEKELKDIVRLPISHVSCYELTYEKNTPLSSAVTNKSVTPLGDDVTSFMYKMAIDLLSLRGFKQYEVANFAKEDRRSRHNIHYWGNNPYIGLGPSAVSYIGGTRSRNVSDVKEYIGRFESGKAITEFSERLSPVRSAKETAAVKIRTKEGIDFDWFKTKTGFEFLELEKRAIPKLLEEDFVKFKKAGNVKTGLCLKRRGFLFCDTVSSGLL